MHKIQKILLKRLLSQNKLKYSDLTSGYNFEDNVVFHLKKLINKNLIRKKGKLYSITTEGLKVIFDLTDLEDSGFKTFFIGLLCSTGNNYLIKEHPRGTKNFYNLPSGKPRFGEKIEDSLKRIFFENTGLSLGPKDFEYKTLHLKTVKTPGGEVLFDDAFAIYKVNIDDMQKEKMKLQKQIRWMNEEEIKKLPNLWPEIDLCILKKDLTPYLTYEFTSNYTL